MTTSSTRLRMGAAVAITTLGLFSLGGSAFAGEGGKSAEHRNERAGADATTADGATDKPSPSEAKAEQFEADQKTYDGTSSRHPSGNDRTVENGGSGTQGNSTSDPDGDLNGGADKPGEDGGLSTLDQDGNNGCGNDQDFEDDNNGWCGGKPKKAKTTTPPATPPVVDGDTTERCPKEGELPQGGTMPAGCETDEEKECPAAGAVAGGTTDMPEGCEEEDEVVTTEVLGGTLTGGTVAPGAVLGTQLQNAAAGEAVETRVLGVTIERGAAAEAAPANGGTGTSVLGASFARGGVLARTGFGLTLAALVGLALVLVGAGLRRAGRSEHGPLA